MNWYMLSCESKYLSESSVKVSSRCDISQEPFQDYVFISVYFGAHKRTDGKCLLFILILM